ncbi:MAG TPA: DUF484 family protein [Acetobacteraceae bacterium]|nr:DUF484 family protein [Acetobacteraceae bacterium]
MSKPAAKRVLAPVPAPPDDRAELVATYLREHPDFLATRPDLYRVLTPPRRIHGENMADHMAAMLSAERSRIRALEGEIEASVSEGRAGASLVLRVRLAVLALMRSRDVVDTVTQELPPLLRVESVSLLAEAARPRPYVPHNRAVAGALETALPHHGLLPLPEGAVARLIGPGREAVVRVNPTDTALLHAEAAPLVTRDALVRVPVWCGTPCLLALGAREASALPSRQSAHTLGFLGRAVAAALAR